MGFFAFFEGKRKGFYSLGCWVSFSSSFMWKLQGFLCKFLWLEFGFKSDFKAWLKGLRSKKERTGGEIRKFSPFLLPSTIKDRKDFLHVHQGFLVGVERVF